MRKQFNPNRNTLSIALARSIERGTSASWYAPLLKGDMDIDAWLRWVDQQSATRQDGSTYPAVYSLMGGGSFAVSEVTRRLWAANLTGCISYTQAIHQGEAFRALAESVTHSFAAKLGRAVPEVTAGMIRVRTQHEASDAPRDMVEEVREAAAHFKAEKEAGRLSQAEYVERMTELNDTLREIRWARAMQGNAVMDSNAPNPSPDEGSIESAIHAVNEMWNYDPKDVMGAERAMIEALHAFKGVDLPIHDGDWDWVTERLAESWAVGLEYAKNDTEREDLARKIEYRAAVAEQGLMADPGKARWATNHISRRIWRDKVMLKRRIEGWQEAIGRTGERIAREEKYNMPAVASRMLSEQPSTRTEDGSERTYFLIWDTVRECDVAPQIHSIFEKAEYVKTANGRTTREVTGREHVRLSQGEYEILVREALIERAEAILEKMDSLYAKVRAVDEALTPVWKAMANDDMPALPPVYWNNKGFYLTEEEAMAAIVAEDAERRLRTLEGVGDLLKEMLAAQGWLK